MSMSGRNDPTCWHIKIPLLARFSSPSRVAFELSLEAVDGDRPNNLTMLLVDHLSRALLDQLIKVANA